MQIIAEERTVDEKAINVSIFPLILKCQFLIARSDFDIYQLIRLSLAEPQS